MNEEVKNILFVCTGNSCRSVMAEAYFKKRIEEEKLDKDILSAGTMGITGMPPAENTVRVLAEEGIDVEGKYSNGLTPEMILWADIILVMDNSHMESILDILPAVQDKIYFLGDFSGEAKNKIIPDPIGRDMEYYRTSLDIIKQSVEGLIKWLQK